MGSARIDVVGGRVLVEAWAASRPTQTPHGYVEETTLDVGPVALGGAVLRCFERYWPQVPRGHGDRVLAVTYRRLGVRSWKGFLDLDPVVISASIGHWRPRQGCCRAGVERDRGCDRNVRS